MTSNQKLELSREIRQWAGIFVSLLGGAAVLAPNETKNFLGNVGRKIRNTAEKLNSIGEK